MLTSASNLDRTRSNDGRIEVLIVDDSITTRAALARIFEPVSDIKVAATAASAETALRVLAGQRVDVILLDLEMPGMGGLDALPYLLRAAGEAQVLVVSSLAVEGAEATLRALAMGAADTLAKPVAGQFDDAYRNELIERVRALAPARKSVRKPAAATPPVARNANAVKLREGCEVVGLGASTGGIHALTLFFRAVPAAVEVPFLVTQHLPATFMPALAGQLTNAARRPCRIAENGMEVAWGEILLAPGHAHLGLVERAGVVRVALDDTPQPSGCTPSVDPMFASLARIYGRRAAAVVLSGMGRDGTQGASLVDAQGGAVLVQDEASCAVFGMPRGPFDLGIAAAALPPADLAGAVVELVRERAWN